MPILRRLLRVGCLWVVLQIVSVSASHAQQLIHQTLQGFSGFGNAYVTRIAPTYYSYTPPQAPVVPAPTFFSTPAARAETQHLLASPPPPVVYNAHPACCVANIPQIAQPVVISQPSIPAVGQPSIPVAIHSESTTVYAGIPSISAASQPSISATSYPGPAPFYSGAPSISAISSSPSGPLTLNSDLSQVVTLRPGAYPGTPSIDAK
jgi:hypothetical protein